MENIYGQTEHERNSIAEIPEGFADKAGNTLYMWLGSLWRSLHEGYSMIRGLQSARGIRMAQMYLNILEEAKLQDRNGAPVFHRELWHPIVIRLSRRDTAQENMLEIGIDGNMGEQPEGSRYGEGTVFLLGKLANLKDYATYPVEADIVGGAECIVDNILNPTVRMEHGKDFEIRNNTIIFHRDNDPLGPDSKFDRYDIPGLVDGSGNPISDMEAVLWASDVLIDKDYVANHISYALGADAPSSDVVKRILNAAWSSVTSGLTPELVKTLLAAMLNIPVIQHDVEKVRSILIEKDADGNAVSRIVQTDMGTYRTSLKATLRKEVVPGAKLVRGDLLDESVRIYPFMNRVSTAMPDESSSSSEDMQLNISLQTPFSVPFEEDIPSVIIPSSMIRARTEYGVYAMWGEEEVKRDEAGRLYFNIGGRDQDVKAFWEDVWGRAESSGIKMDAVLGGEGSKVSPAAFFLKHLIGANTIFIVVDRSQIDDVSMMRNPMFFDMLSDVVPSAIRLFLVEHRSVGDGDIAQMDEASEACSLAAALPEATDVAESSGEQVLMRFFRPPPAHVRGKREEEKV